MFPDCPRKYIQIIIDSYLLYRDGNISTVVHNNRDSTVSLFPGIHGKTNFHLPFIAGKRIFITNLGNSFRHRKQMAFVFYRQRNGCSRRLINGIFFCQRIFWIDWHADSLSQNEQKKKHADRYRHHQPHQCHCTKFQVHDGNENTHKEKENV